MMRNLLQTHSISRAESVRIVLESEGIEAVVVDGNAPGYLGLAETYLCATVDGAVVLG
jgi:hypothetical protein